MRATAVRQALAVVMTIIADSIRDYRIGDIEEDNLDTNVSEHGRHFKVRNDRSRHEHQ